MSGFSFLLNTVKMLTLTIDCSAGTLPDLVKAISVHLAKLPVSICRLIQSVPENKQEAMVGKEGETPVHTKTAPFNSTSLSR